MLSCYGDKKRAVGRGTFRSWFSIGTRVWDTFAYPPAVFRWSVET